MTDDASTSEQDKRTNLGRGLAALFGEESEEYASLDKVRAAKTVPIEHLHPNRLQPRQDFDTEALEALAESIAANGILQPILVRRHPDRPSEFEIVAGERRWRAAQIAQMYEVPVVIRELTDSQALELSLVENVQRQDLAPLEEAEGYRRLIEEFRHTQDEIAHIIGKSRSHIANTLRLLNLPEAVKAFLVRGALSAGHARALLGAEDPEALAEKIVARGLNVRQTERLVQSGRGRAGGLAAGEGGRPAGGASSPPAGKDPDTMALERDLTALLGLKVTIELRGQGGSLTIHYQTLEQLDDVLHRLNQPPQQGAA
ncbi:MAG: ParB/RepB/Spo0J family partition protein [Kiloniellaceae bacterium]